MIKSNSAGTVGNPRPNHMYVTGNIKRPTRWNGATNKYEVDPEFKARCDYCGSQIWKGHSVIYWNYEKNIGEKESFNVCDSCLLKVYEDTDAGKALMLSRRMEASAGIYEEDNAEDNADSGSPF